MLKRLIAKMALSTGLLGLGFAGAVTTTHAIHIPITSVVHADKRTDAYWTNRINRYAPKRRAYYHPEITYDTRDLGGLKTVNGKYQIRPGMLYRSANLHYVHWSNAMAIKRLNITQDIDLRHEYGPNSSIHTKPQPGEIKQMPDRYGMHLHYIHYPVETSHQEAITWPIRKRLGENYRFGYWYTTNPAARRAYHNTITYMSRPHKGAILFNCTQGRDRTGVVSIILEYLLGISQRDIYNEFMLTNYYKYQSPYSSQVARIHHFYRTARAGYGSMYRYCHYGLYLPQSTINRLRRKYLEPVPGYRNNKYPRTHHYYRSRRNLI